jgi:glycosyltransferase involved in cell wall biosynthesis
MTLKPFNILLLSSYGSLKGGGQESFFQLVTNLDERIFHSYVALPTEGGLAKKLRVHGIEVTVLELPKMINLQIQRNCKALYRLLKLSNQYKLDLIHTDGPRNTFYAGLVAKIRRIPLVWHVRASNRDRYDRLLYHLSSRIILVANSIKSRFDWIEKSNKFVTIYNGIDLSEFRGNTPAMSIRKQYGISDKSIVIAVIARIERLKGQKDLIEACERLKNTIKDFYILLVGEIADLPYFKECKDKAKEVAIQERIIFTGYQDQEEISHILNEIDIFVLPSLFEAFPRSLIEAMGAGKPVVATDVGGCREAVEDRVSGFIVPAGSPRELAERIDMLAMDSELRVMVGKNARIRAERMFSIEHNVKQTEQLYLKAIMGNQYDIP